MKTYIFDFDGTLVDSMEQWAGKTLKILNDLGVSYPDDIIKIITPLGDLGTANYIREKLGVTLSPEEILSLMDKNGYEAYRSEIQAKPAVIETLYALREKGESLNVLTASPHKMLDVCLKRLEIFDIFDNVWSCDDFETTKADVNIYKRAAEKLGKVAEDCIFLDDNINALRTAKTAGMKVIGVYDETSEDFTEEIKALSDGYIDSFSEILNILY